MCLMPFKKDLGQRESDDYCSYCFKSGEFSYKGDDIQEFKQICYQQMVKKGTPKLIARFIDFMLSFAPHWTNIKKDN